MIFEGLLYIICFIAGMLFERLYVSKDQPEVTLPIVVEEDNDRPVVLIAFDEAGSDEDEPQ